MQVGAGRAAGGSVMPNSVHPITENGSEVVSTPSGNVLVMGNEGGSGTPVGSGGGRPIVISLTSQLVMPDGRVIAEALNEFNASSN